MEISIKFTFFINGKTKQKKIGFEIQKIHFGNQREKSLKKEVTDFKGEITVEKGKAQF